MEATFRALGKRGYADLRMRDIGAEFEMTRQLIHYYYDGKHDLISAFLEYVIEQYEGSVEVGENDDPWAELDPNRPVSLRPQSNDFDHWDRMRVYHELFSQAQNDTGIARYHATTSISVAVSRASSSAGSTRRLPRRRSRVHGTVHHRRDTRRPWTADLARTRRRTRTNASCTGRVRHPSLAPPNEEPQFERANSGTRN